MSPGTDQRSTGTGAVRLLAMTLGLAVLLGPGGPPGSPGPGGGPEHGGSAIVAPRSAAPSPPQPAPAPPTSASLVPDELERLVDWLVDAARSGRPPDDPTGPLDADPRPTVRQWPAALQTYPGSCDREPAGLQEVHRTTNDPRRFAWGWRTCPRPGGPDLPDAPTVVLLLQAVSTRPEAAATHLVVQYPDGDVRAFETNGGEEPDRFVQLGAGTGGVRRHPGGFEGHLRFDPEAVGLPGVYRFVALSIDAAGGIAQLPGPDHPDELLHPRRCRAVSHTPRDDLRQRLGTAATAGGWLPAAINAPRHPASGDDPTAAATSEPGVPVAVVDSGIAALPALVDVMAGFDAVTGQVIEAARDSAHGSHGTLVASVIAASATEAASGVVGVAPGTPLVPVRVTGHDGCLSSRSVVAALDAIVQQGQVRVVNLSFGGVADPALAAALDRAAAAGLILVAATGNDADLAPGRRSFPADHPGVIGVGATTAAGAHAPYSQLAGAEIHAPGGSLACLRQHRCHPSADLVAYDRFGEPRLVAGTSYAAGVVSAAIARWLRQHPGASLDEVRTALVASGRPLALPHPSPSGVALDLGRLLAERVEQDPGAWIGDAR